ncbi:hypothetical protein CLOHIR_01554 [Peptacetobacter hiranonis DSM 13275]|uniref:Uncharacterized protein n=1 Tax=Peptacetobacter hiranonis (strain DSM 13275 / JCM 10541 / KCTC 15199 / TO-931) TaxID=500633 RepID=B6G098_PEPHT|nr:hypothetical protein CLOHIR_01554 [Peptacetobacter hiranonis DSM 13275]
MGAKKRDCELLEMSLLLRLEKKLLLFKKITQNAMPLKVYNPL